MTSAAIQKYAQNQLMTSSKGQQLSFLYETVARAFDDAAVAISEQRYEDCYRLTERICDIVEALRTNLDTSIPGSESMVKVLSDYYIYIISSTSRIFQEGGEAHARKLAESVRTLASAWLEVEKKAGPAIDLQDPAPKTYEASSAPPSFQGEESLLA